MERYSEPNCGLRPKETFHREDRKLIASEETGTNLRRQHRQVTARAAEQLQPAHGEMRIEILQVHVVTTLRVQYSLKTPAPEPLSRSRRLLWSQIKTELGVIWRGVHPIAIFTLAAISHILASVGCRRRSRGPVCASLRITVTFSDWATQGYANPISPGCNEVCVGESFGMAVESGTTRTVAARSCRLRASLDTTTTVLGPLPGGSVGLSIHQISPRTDISFFLAPFIGW